MSRSDKEEVLLCIFLSSGSGPHAALAAFIKDRSVPTVPDVGDAASAHVEAALVIWVGVQAVRFAVAEAGSWGVGGGGGGGDWGRCGSTRFGSGGGGQWGQLNVKKFAEMRQQRVVALSAESSSKVIQIEGPHKGTAKLLLLHVLHLDLIALPVVKSHPLIVLGGVWNFLVLNPLNGGALQKTTDLIV